MPTRLSWRNLIPGLVALAALTAIVVAVLSFGGIGRVRGETIRLHVATDQARGVLQGTEVWLDGQKTGVVTAVGFQPPSADTLHRVVISVDVRREDAVVIRRDSRVRVRTGGSVVGPVVVSFESGSPGSPQVRGGDTIQALEQSDGELAMERLAVATSELPTLVVDGKTVMAQLRSPNGTVGAFLTRGLPSGEIARMRGHVSSLRARLGSGSGTAEIPGIMTRVRTVMARTDSVRALIASPNTSYGRFRRDTTLKGTIGGLVAELDSLRADLENSPGTLGRLRSDSAIHFSLMDARREMTLLFEDLARRPLRYIHF